MYSVILKAASDYNRIHYSLLFWTGFILCSQSSRHCMYVTL